MSKAQISMWEEKIVDSFAGGGGASTGIELATGRVVDIAINHDPDAILMHKTNHPHTVHTIKPACGMWTRSKLQEAVRWDCCGPLLTASISARPRAENPWTSGFVGWPGSSCGGLGQSGPA